MNQELSPSRRQKTPIEDWESARGIACMIRDVVFICLECDVDLRRRNRVSTLKAVDLFSGAGGGSMGLEAIDEPTVDVVGAVDYEETACETYAKNEELSGDPWRQDLTQVDFSDIADHFGFDPDEIDLVMGCPPCQNFSWLRDTDPWPEDEPKDTLLKTFVRLVAEADPEFVVFENVRGLLSKDDGQYADWLKKRMNPESREELETTEEDFAPDVVNLDYGMAFKLVNAADYGVPQSRKRVIGLFAKGRSNDELSFPEPTHAPKEEAENSDKEEWKTFREAVDDLPPLERGEKWDEDPAHRARRHHDSTLERIKAIPEDGGSRTDIEDEELILDCHEDLDRNSASNVYGRIRWDDPAPTMTTRCTTPSCGRFVHPEQHRSLTFREAARVMSFPDIELPDKNDAAERVVGNAVPPDMIESIVGRFLQSKSVRTRTVAAKND